MEVIENDINLGCLDWMLRIRHDEEWCPEDDIDDLKDAKCDKCEFPISPDFIESADKRILFHDNLIEETSEIFESYRNLVKLPMDFKPLMFRELFSVGKNLNAWKELSKSFSCEVPTYEIGNGSITVKKLDDDQILILIIQRMTINDKQEIVEVVTVIDHNLQLIRENIVERFVSADSVEVE